MCKYTETHKLYIIWNFLIFAQKTETSRKPLFSLDIIWTKCSQVYFFLKGTKRFSKYLSMCTVSNQAGNSFFALTQLKQQHLPQNSLLDNSQRDR